MRPAKGTALQTLHRRTQSGPKTPRTSHRANRIRTRHSQRRRKPKKRRLRKTVRRKRNPTPAVPMAASPTTTPLFVQQRLAKLPPMPPRKNRHWRMQPLRSAIKVRRSARRAPTICTMAIQRTREPIRRRPREAMPRSRRSMQRNSPPGPQVYRTRARTLPRREKMATRRPSQSKPKARRRLWHSRGCRDQTIPALTHRPTGPTTVRRLIPRGLSVAWRKPFKPRTTAAVRCSCD